MPELEDHAGIARVESLPSQNLTATYFDTEDLRLARSGATLRFRSGEENPGWTLKLPDLTGADDTRTEFHFDGPPTAVPEDARDLITAFVRSGSIAPVASLKTRRRRWSLRDSEARRVAEIDDDDVSILHSKRVVARFREIEVEAREGDRISLAHVANVLRAAGAVDSEPLPKAVRALGPRATAPPDVPSPQPVEPSDRAAVAVRASISAGTRRLILNDPPARLGDVEGVHQMRVAARRLRSDLRMFSPLIEPAWGEELIIELKWIADCLGSVRDFDVLAARLSKHAEGLEEPLRPMFDSLKERSEKARLSLNQALKSRRYIELLERLVIAASLPNVTESAYHPCWEALPPLAQKRWKRLAALARKLDKNDSDESFHEVRIKAKRARYAAEAIGPALGADRAGDARTFAKLTADLQDLLGEHQDAVVAQRFISEAATQRPQDAPFNLSAGRLIEREAGFAAAARARFARRWGKLDRKRHLRWVEE